MRKRRRLPGAAELTGATPVAGDFDGDGHADLVTSTSTGSRATVRFGPFTRAGKPARTNTLDLTPDKSSYYTARPTGVGDVNGDGAADPAVGTWYASGADDRVRVLRGGLSGISTSGPTLIGPADLGLKPAPGDSSDFGH